MTWKKTGRAVPETSATLPIFNFSNGLLDCTTKRLILAPLRPENLFFHYCDIDHMEVVYLKSGAKNLPKEKILNI